MESYPEFRVAYTRGAVTLTDDHTQPQRVPDLWALHGLFWVTRANCAARSRHRGVHRSSQPHDSPHLRVGAGTSDLSIYNGYWYWGRPTMHELHVDLRASSRKSGRNLIWAHQLREAWDRGDRDIFLVDTLDEPIRFPRAGPSGTNVVACSGGNRRSRPGQALAISRPGMGSASARRHSGAPKASPKNRCLVGHALIVELHDLHASSWAPRRR